MGDAYVWVADVDARPEDAAVLAGRAMDWLEEQGVVRSELTQCLFGDELGRAPGPHAARAIAGDEVADALTSGVGMDVERRVYVCVDLWTATCPHCGATTEPPDSGAEMWSDAWSPLLDALYAWFGGTGPGRAACVRCGQQADLLDWKIDPPVAVAHLGLVFWNWPPLSGPFLADLSAVLDGHRLVTARTGV
ncbi:MAG TPA: hypothetical protein VFH94_09585 [Streptomyces sp.]|nr:hypothetical protein [Streptomyces sp.]